MNSQNVLFSMNEIDDDYIWQAYDKLNGIRPIYGRKTVKRILITVAALTAVLLGSFTTAMALNEEFRAFVFQFFRAGEEQVIPETTTAPDADPMELHIDSPVKIGPVIEGRCVSAPLFSHVRNGMYFVCTDGIELRQGSHYSAYYEDNGRFIPLEEQHFSRDYFLLGDAIHLEFSWVQYNGMLEITQIESEAPCRIDSQTFDGQNVLIQIQNPLAADSEQMMDSYYPVLLNLETGIITDVLSGTGAEDLCGIDRTAISEDHSKMLIGQATTEEYLLHYADLSAGKLFYIDDLSGEHADGCSLIGNTLTCWSLWGGHYKAWSLDLQDFRRRELFDHIPSAYTSDGTGAGIVALQGFDSINYGVGMFLGSRFALETDADQCVFVIDLLSGDRVPVEGLIWPGNATITPSPDGRKLLLTAGPDGMAIHYVGILDFEKRIYAEFDRRNLNDANEYDISWFDRNAVIIGQERPADRDRTDYYIYKLNS